MTATSPATHALTSAGTPKFARLASRWLAASAALCLMVCAAPSGAQTTNPDALKGQLLFTDTPNQGVPPTITSRCSNCHGTVFNRRSSIGGSLFADISFSTAYNHLTNAIATRAPMAQFKALTDAQVSDLAAYIADTPKVSAPGMADAAPHVLAFSTSAGTPVKQSLTVKQSVATADSLVISAIDLGTDATGTAFSVDSACLNATLAPAASCDIAIGYAPAAGSADESRTLTVTMQQGINTITRVVTLNGTVTAPPPPPAPGPVCFYEHINYQGASFCTEADSGWIGNAWNDRISSVKVPAGRHVELFQHAGFAGRVLVLNADAPNFVPLNFNDVVSSYRITAQPAGGTGAQKKK